MRGTGVGNWPGTPRSPGWRWRPGCAAGRSRSCWCSRYRPRRWLMGDASDPGLIGDLRAGLAGLVHPHGTVDAAGTITSYLIGLRDIAAFMAARGVAGGAAALTRAVLAGYWMQAGVMREAT